LGIATTGLNPLTFLKQKLTASRKQSKLIFPRTKSVPMPSIDKPVELLAVIGASCAIVAANVSTVLSNKSLLRLLVRNKNRIETLNNLLTTIEGRVADMEKYLSVNNGYQIRESITKLTENLRQNLSDEDTGF
jgi:hypothetical protein